MEKLDIVMKRSTDKGKTVTPLTPSSSISFFNFSESIICPVKEIKPDTLAKIAYAFYFIGLHVC